MVIQRWFLGLQSGRSCHEFPEPEHLGLEGVFLDLIVEHGYANGVFAKTVWADFLGAHLRHER